MARSSVLATFPFLFPDGTTGAAVLPASDRRRVEVIDDSEDDEKADADSEAPADQLLLDRQQPFGLGLVQFLGDIRLRHLLCSQTQPANGGFTPAKNSQEIKSPTRSRSRTGSRDKRRQAYRCPPARAS